MDQLWWTADLQDWLNILVVSTMPDFFTLKLWGKGWNAVDIRLQYSPLVHNLAIGPSASPIDMIVPVNLAMSWAVIL